MAVLDRFYCSLFLLMYCIFLLQHENIYRGLVRTLLHPLGTPDHTTGLRPGDLLDHLREVCFHCIDCYAFLMHEYLLNHLLLKPRDRLQDMQPNTIECGQKHCSSTAYGFQIAAVSFIAEFHPSHFAVLFLTYIN